MGQSEQEQQQQQRLGFVGQVEVTERLHKGRPVTPGAGGGAAGGGGIEIHSGVGGCGGEGGVVIDPVSGRQQLAVGPLDAALEELGKAQQQQEWELEQEEGGGKGKMLHSPGSGLSTHHHQHDYQHQHQHQQRGSGGCGSSEGGAEGLRQGRVHNPMHGGPSSVGIESMGERHPFDKDMELSSSAAGLASSHGFFSQDRNLVGAEEGGGVGRQILDDFRRES